MCAYHRLPCICTCTCTCVCLCFVYVCMSWLGAIGSFGSGQFKSMNVSKQRKSVYRFQVHELRAMSVSE